MVAPFSCQVGPLNPGYHTLAVRTVSVDGTMASPSLSSTWLIATQSNSTVDLSDLADGMHSLVVVASDSVGHTEQSPRQYQWIVDTTPPTTSALLTSPALTNVSHGVVAAACVGEQFPALCSFCWQLALAGAVVSSGCGAAGVSSLVLSLPADGRAVAFVSAVDAAGNRGAAVNVTWLQDTTPPHTSANITSPTMYVPILGASAINTSYLTLAVNASEPVSSYRVVVYRLGDASATVSGLYVAASGVLSIPSLLQVRLGRKRPVVALICACRCYQQCEGGDCCEMMAIPMVYATRCRQRERSMPHTSSVCGPSACPR